MPKLTSQVSEFLNPKSMMTPGLAGGFTMTIVNTLWVQFGPQPKWCALGLSFTLGVTQPLRQPPGGIGFTVDFTMSTIGEVMAAAADEAVEAMVQGAAFADALR